ncbi:thiamine phosphate synthase [Euryhalocaulis caribicus]|uniref:thiamine phosphate synthase n=1 Tax=Euryhalocaulis caribicus TaxID=1161401 RepID=UPI0003A19A64|nr:thiamine phosphate synthase [Euryhalocaulis caribicus]
MQARYGPADALASLTARMNGAGNAPALFLFTDPQRTPDPAAAARALPPGSGVIYRHFGRAERVEEAAALAEAARDHGLTLLIAADPELANTVGAAGVHWPEWALPRARRVVTNRFAVNSAAAHTPLALRRAAAAGMDFAFISPVFETGSASARRPLGIFRVRLLARESSMPLYALGGLNPHNAKRLENSGLSGIGAVDALNEA